jgi:hypothetical protein
VNVVELDISIQEIEMNLFELTDEQLEKVVGGNAANYANQFNGAFAPTSNAVAFGHNVIQTGSNVEQLNLASQSATNITKLFGPTYW